MCVTQLLFINGMQPEVSIIMPLYNATQYVELCLQSICNQTFDDIEVVMIDDCSKDDTVEVVERYISQYTGNILLRLLCNQQNMGPGKTRNRGINLATGKYIMFVDSDDLLPPDAVCQMQNAANSYGVEAVLSNFSFMQPETDTIPLSLPMSDEYPLIATGQYETNTTIFSFRSKFVGVPWGKLILRSFLAENEITFSDAYREEDSCWWLLCLFRLSNIYVLNKPLYFYRKGHDSLMTVNNNDEYMLNQKIINLKHAYNYVVTHGMYSGKCMEHVQANRTHLIKWAFNISRVDTRTIFDTLCNLSADKHEEFQQGCVGIKAKINNLYLILPSTVGYFYMKLLSTF